MVHTHTALCRGAAKRFYLAKAWYGECAVWHVLLPRYTSCHGEQRGDPRSDASSSSASHFGNQVGINHYSEDYILRRMLDQGAELMLKQHIHRCGYLTPSEQLRWKQPILAALCQKSFNDISNYFLEKLRTPFKEEFKQFLQLPSYAPLKHITLHSLSIQHCALAHISLQLGKKADIDVLTSATYCLATSFLAVPRAQFLSNYCITRSSRFIIPQFYFGSQRIHIGVWRYALHVSTTTA